jgi:hypothetical protein
MIEIPVDKDRNFLILNTIMLLDYDNIKKEIFNKYGGLIYVRKLFECLNGKKIKNMLT